MSSTAAVKGEIERFLKSPNPEVVCVTGAWGAGKTYTWQAIFDRLRNQREIAMQRYSYVSLFGVNSLEGMKSAIFENLEFLVPQARSGFEALLSGGNSLFKQSKQLVGVAGAIPIVGGYVAKGQPLLFNTIRNQIVCVDDLERRSGISVKDVFGLISFLREQRGCKIILLLNESQLEADAAKEFSDYFEKVIDSKLVFAPTPADAASIAITSKDDVSALTREFCEKLSISNIRVIKKIERLIAIADLARLSPSVRKSAIHSMVMFGWCKFDSGANPPPISYMRQSSLSKYLERRGSKEKPSAEEARWDSIISAYEWGTLDDLDAVLLDFVDSGVLDADKVNRCVAQLEAKQDRADKLGKMQQAWNVFHGGFADNKNAVCAALIEGFKASFDVLSRRNLDEVVSVLRELDRAEDADGLVSFAEERCEADFWADDPFERGVKDSRIRQVLAERQKAATPAFNFEDDLITAAEKMDRGRQAQLAKVPVERYQELFEQRTGDRLGRLIHCALDYRRIINASDDEQAIVSRAEAALRAIAKKSRLNELRLQRYGVTLDEPASEDGEPKAE
ncbi:P-loop NTPase fold protein [Bradyrhizobium guangdongense]